MCVHSEQHTHTHQCLNPLLFFFFFFFLNFHLLFKKDSPKKLGSLKNKIHFLISLPIKMHQQTQLKEKVSSFSFQCWRIYVDGGGAVGAEGGMHPALRQVARHNICLWKIPAVALSNPTAKGIRSFLSFYPFSISMCFLVSHSSHSMSTRKLFNKILDRSPKVVFFFFLL